MADARPCILKALDKQNATALDISRYSNEYSMLEKARNVRGVVQPLALEQSEGIWLMVLEDVGGGSLWQWLQQRAIKVRASQPRNDSGRLLDSAVLDPQARGSFNYSMDQEDYYIIGGSNESARIPALAKMPLEPALRIAINLAKTLAALHEIPMIHKNVTPQNIVWNPQSGEIRLIDFALAVVGQTEKPFELQGTLAWICPEQTARINRMVDRRSDLYGLGATLYTLLTGKTPFKSTDVMEMLHCVMAVDPPVIYDESVPEIVSKIVAKLLRKSPEDRYQSAEGVLADLEMCLEKWYKSRQMGQRPPQVEGFELGEYDLRRLEIPHKLYGREREIAEIHRAFEDVSSETRPEVVLIGGPSGIGKTSMVWEAVATGVLQRKGNFVQSKVDQQRKGQPYYAILRGFSEFLRSILKEDANVVDAWRRRFDRMSPAMAAIMADQIPELRYFIEVKAVPQAPILQQAQERFNMAFLEFVVVFMDESRPLVMFLDDMQWIDNASLRLIETILDTITANQIFHNNASHPFLFIGSYRSNEVHPGHALLGFFNRIQDQGIRISDIMLEPLTVEDVVEMVSDTVGKAKHKESVQELARIVFEKAGGNPFYIKALLFKMYEERMFTQVCDRITRKLAWGWNLSRIRQLGIMDNVADILVNTMSHLNQDSRTAVQTAACFGNTFTLEDLAVVLEQPPRIVADALHETIEKGLVAGKTFFSSRISADMDDETVRKLIESDRPSYMFLHDKILQAAYGLNSKEQLEKTHVAIARCLAAKLTGLAEQDQKLIYGVLEHYKKGFEFVLRQQNAVLEEELQRLVLLNRSAGEASLRSGLYQDGYKYFLKALELKDFLRGHRPIVSPEDPDYQELFGLHYSAAEAAYLSMQYEDTNRLVQIMDEYVIDPLDKGQVQTLQIRVSFARDRPQETILRSLLVLDNLGINIPRNPNRMQLRNLYSELNNFVKHKSDQELIALPDISEKRDRFIIRILNDLIIYTLHYEPRLYTAVALNFALITLKTGHNPYGFVIYATLLSSVFKDYESAYRFCSIAMERVERTTSMNLLDNTATDNSVKSRTYVGALSFGLDYKQSLRGGIPVVEQALDIATQTGVSEDMAQSALKLGFDSWWGGVSPKKFFDTREGRDGYASRIMATIMSVKRARDARWAAPYLQAMACLANLNVPDPSRLVGDHFNMDEELAKPIGQRFSDDSTAAVLACGIEMCLAYMWNDYDRAERDLRLLYDAQTQARAYRLPDLIPMTWWDILIRIKLLQTAKIRKNGKAKMQALREQIAGQMQSQSDGLSRRGTTKSSSSPKGRRSVTESQSSEGDVIDASELVFLPDPEDVAFWSNKDAYGNERIQLNFWSEYKAKQKIRELMDDLKKYSDMAPMNHLHRYLLAQAEFAGYEGRMEAMGFYEQAAKQAREQGFLWECALIRELQVQFLIQYGNVTSSRQLITEARTLYDRDGAVAKADHVSRIYSTLMEYRDSMAMSKSVRSEDGDEKSTSLLREVDVMALIKTNQAISQQLTAHRLIKIVCSVILEYSGAQRVDFVHFGRSAPRIWYEAWVDNPDAPIDNAELPPSVLDRRTTLPITSMDMGDLEDEPTANVTRNRAASAPAKGFSIPIPNGKPNEVMGNGTMNGKVSSVTGSIDSSTPPTEYVKPEQGVALSNAQDEGEGDAVMLQTFEPPTTRRPSLTWTDMSPDKSETPLADTPIKPARRVSILQPPKESEPLSPGVASPSDERPEKSSNIRIRFVDKAVDHDMVPLSVLNYVNRTKEPVCLDNALMDQRFAHDYYIRKYQPRSVLCQGLISEKNKNVLLGMVYLEHREATGIFNPGRLVAMDLILGQAAVSMENARLYTSINKFVPSDMIGQLKHNSVMDVQLGDCIDTEMGVMFTEYVFLAYRRMLTVCSIRDFTSLSESMSARRTLNFLNGYLSRMQPVIEQNNGIIDKYFGDGILALWPGDPDHAVESAMSMQRELWDYNEQLAEDPTFGGREIRIGIGIHFGRLMMGAIGAKNRIDMSVIGDTVNLASRLEGLTKFYKIDVMISESTHVRLKNPAKFNFRVLDMVRPKGKHEAIRIYECKFYSL